jgi:hypothetical protein
MEMTTTKKVLLGAGGLLALLYLVGANSPDGSGSTSTSTSTSTSNEPAAYPKLWSYMRTERGNISEKGCGLESKYECPLFGDSFGWVIYDHDGDREICALSGNNERMKYVLNQMKGGLPVTDLRADELPPFYEHCFNVDTGEQSARSIGLQFPKLAAKPPAKQCVDDADPRKTAACFGITNLAKR